MLILETEQLGCIQLEGSIHHGLSSLSFLRNQQQAPVSNGDPLLQEVAERLQAYLKGRIICWDDIPLAPQGTDFQRRVWQALCTIPYGETRSYAWLAKAVGNPKAIRAVGGANGKNPIPIIIPCHRVIQKDGRLGGYSAPGGLAIKQQLLELETACIAQYNLVTL